MPVSFNSMEKAKIKYNDLSDWLRFAFLWTLLNCACSIIYILFLS